MIILAGVLALLALAVIILKLVISFTTSANEISALSHNRKMIDIKEKIARYRKYVRTTRSEVDRARYVKDIADLVQQAAAELETRNQLLDPNVSEE